MTLILIRQNSEPKFSELLKSHIAAHKPVILLKSIIESPLTEFSTIIQIREWIEVLKAMPKTGQRNTAIQEAKRMLSYAEKRKTDWKNDT